MQYRKSTRPYDFNLTAQLIYYFPIYVNLFDFERRKCVKWKEAIIIFRKLNASDNQEQFVKKKTSNHLGYIKYKMSKDCNIHPETVVELLNLGQLGTEAEPGQKQTN